MSGGFSDFFVLPCCRKYSETARIGTQALACYGRLKSTFQLWTCPDKSKIKARIQEQFGYDLDRKLSAIRPSYWFDVSCQGTVPEAIIAFLESTSYEDAVRNAISLGGDSDTLACITGTG